MTRPDYPERQVTEALRRERDEAQSMVQAWVHVADCLEAHIMDRAAMQDPASPETYLSILRSEVAGVRRSSEQICASRWADYKRHSGRIAELEAALAATTRSDDEDAECPTCQGRGEVWVFLGGLGRAPDPAQCDDCQGTGRIASRLKPDAELRDAVVREIERYGEGLVPELRIVCAWLVSHFRDPEVIALLSAHESDGVQHG
jgi:hypothetical protein